MSDNIMILQFCNDLFLIMIDDNDIWKRNRKYVSNKQLHPSFLLISDAQYYLEISTAIRFGLLCDILTVPRNRGQF